MDKDTALKLALEALEANFATWSAKTKAIPIIKEALSQPEQKPVANGIIRTLVSIDKDGIETWKHEPFYTTPPQRKPLPPQSPCEMTQAEGKMFKLGWLECEAAHGIKGE